MPAIAFSTEIKAPRRLVWERFNSLPAYEDWNPFIIDAVGTIRRDVNLTLKISTSSGTVKSFRPHVDQVDIGKKVVWTTGNLLFSRQTTFTLIEQPGGNVTTFNVEIEFKGLLAPLKKGFVDELESGYRKMAEALRDRVEQSAASATT